MRVAVASFFAAVFSASALLAAPQEPAILILPFSSVAEGGNVAIAKGVQHDLAANLAFGKMKIIAPNVAIGATDAESARQSAREVNASIVIFGQSQSSGNNIRLSGEVLDVATGKPLGGLKATGASDDLFHMEDILGAQAMWALPPSMRDNNALMKATEIATRVPDPIQPAAATTPANQPIITIPAIPQTYPVDPFPATPVSYPVAPYYDPYTAAYPYYGYGYGFYSPVIFSSGFGRFGRGFNGFHNGGFGRFGGFNSGLNGGFNGGFGRFNSGFGGFHSGFGGGFHSGGSFHSGAMFTGGFSGGHR